MISVRTENRELFFDVRRTPFPLRFQLSRRLHFARGPDLRVCCPRYVRHGPARPQWTLWLSALLPCSPKSRPQSSHRRRSELRSSFIAAREKLLTTESQRHRGNPERRKIT